MVLFIVQEMQRRMQEQEQRLGGGRNTIVDVGEADGFDDEIIDDEDQEDDDELIVGDDEEKGRKVFGTMTGDGLEVT